MITQSSDKPKDLGPTLTVQPPTNAHQHNSQSSLIESVDDVFKGQSENHPSPRTKKVKSSEKPNPIHIDIRIEKSAEGPLKPRSSPRDMNAHGNMSTHGKEKLLPPERKCNSSPRGPIEKQPDNNFDDYLNSLISELSDPENFVGEKTKKNANDTQKVRKNRSESNKLQRQNSKLMLKPLLNQNISKVPLVTQTILPAIDLCVGLGDRERKESPHSNTTGHLSFHSNWNHSKKSLNVNKEIHLSITDSKRHLNMMNHTPSEDLDNHLAILKKKHNSLNSFMKEGWDYTKKVDVSDQIIQNRIENYVESEIGTYFSDTTRTFNEFLNESQWANGIISFIQNGGVPIREIYVRSKILYKLVEFYHHQEKISKSWEIQLETYLKKLSNIDSQIKYKSELKTGKEISKFLHIYDEVCENHRVVNNGKSAHLLKWVQAAFGNTREEIDGVVDTLRRWSSLKSNSHNELTNYIWDISLKMGRLEYLYSYFTNIVHYWHQDPTVNTSNISKITAREIARCIKPEPINGIIFDLITVNGDILWDVSQFDIKDYAVDNKKFYSTLFAAFEKKEQIEEKHEKQAIFFIDAANEDCYDVPEVTNKHVPWLGLMRLMANSNWGYADQYLRHLIPGIFELPYWTKLESGIECHIMIENNGHYHVTQIRKMAIFLRQNPEDENSYATGEVQVRFNICWEVQPESNGWKGRLWIKDCEVIKDDHWNDIKQRLVDIKDVEHVKDKIAGYQFKTVYPFSNEERKILKI